MFDICYVTDHWLSLLYYRYVATAVTSVHDMENGFNIWSFHGKHLYRILKDNFYQVILVSFVIVHFFCVCVLQWSKERLLDVQLYMVIVF
jgi:hypothetical protein